MKLEVSILFIGGNTITFKNVTDMNSTDLYLSLSFKKKHGIVTHKSIMFNTMQSFAVCEIDEEGD